MFGISRDPNGVNVNSQGATSVFITFGNLANQRPVEAFWCGRLISAAPDIGFRCDPATLFGQLPIRFDQSRLNAGGTVYSDVMTIPPSVARRAYQDAQSGATSSFYYVRRFVSTVGGPDEYVFVTCRMAGGGARVPLALLDVQMSFQTDKPVQHVRTGERLSRLSARIAYNGSGRLRGRWEIVVPGDEPPVARDLLTEATLPPEERPLQRRYTLLERFDVFLPPTGTYVLPGPRPELLPAHTEGLYMVLLRVEASDDKEGDSNLALAGAGTGIVHSGGVAGFPLPPLRYYVGAEGSVPTVNVAGVAVAQLVAPLDNAVLPGAKSVDFNWLPATQALSYRLEVTDANGTEMLSALLMQGTTGYRSPPG
ncbi:MAG: hypothetical protein FJY37_16405 [Betaproteobacteria bacterium]|nr:hypothetical protein [Betaproteobacteria bacterium]